ncbi:9987_t:CDS:2 [Cetraspora pellucida]|uniref:9987_t:CDS:1 n=1 Tax=Cetraspora pellucida TaxID=1433469 RepID=A0A9N9HZK1_9GLOM|nr:9987_t:CDS:2 [Cetraspora pellucida]
MIKALRELNSDLVHQIAELRKKCVNVKAENIERYFNESQLKAENQPNEKEAITSNPMPEIEHSSTQSESLANPKTSETFLLQDIIDKDLAETLDFAERVVKEREPSNVISGGLSINQDQTRENTYISIQDPPSIVQAQKTEFHSSEVKISYNQKIEQDIIQEVILFIQKEKLLTSSTNISETQDSNIEVVRLFSNAEIAEGKTIKTKQKETICWCTYRKSYQNTVAKIRTKTGVAEKTARSQVYAIIKTSLPKVSESNLRKKTQRAGNAYKLFIKIVDPVTKKEVKGIGINKVYGILYGTKSISELTDT